MGTAVVNPTPKAKMTEKTLFDLSTFEEVTLYKEVAASPVSSVQDALARLGGDSNKLLAVINDGLLAEATREARLSPEGWFAKDDEDKLIAFEGVPANAKKVNGLVLNLAKSVFGFGKDMTKDQKRDAKTAAKDMIKNTTAIREGLAKNAAMDDDD